MSTWVELYQNVPFILVTGDGARYTPIMRNANLSTEFNIATFNFRNIKGTLVDRRNPMGNVYDLYLIFQGENHVDTAKAFRKSANDRKPWTLQHPLYGRLVAQPISAIKYDNSDATLNTTQISVTIQETIQKSQITFSTDTTSVIKAKNDTTQAALTTGTITHIPKPTLKDTNYLLNNGKSIYGSVQVGITDAKDAEAYANQYNAMLNSVQAAIINGISEGIADTQALISAPATFVNSTANRVNFLVNTFNILAADAQKSIDGIGSAYTASAKNLFLNTAGTAITSMALSSVNDISDTDYTYSSDVLSVISDIVKSYNTYMALLDGLQTYNGLSPDAFIPDAESIILLTDQVNYTISVLFGIAANAKQPRTLTLIKDSNWIYIAAQIYGLLPDDSTVTRIIADNNGGPREMIQVLKGREILYYA